MRSMLDRYHELRDRLTRRLGSPELASDALHETWLRLEKRADFDTVTNPVAYLYRATLNTAINLRKSETRRLTRMEIEDILSIADDAPGPHAIAEGRAELAALAVALGELPERQRAIFQASFADDIPHRDLAARFGVSVRTIQIDLKRAVAHCARRMKGQKRFAVMPGRLSDDDRGSAQ